LTKQKGLGEKCWRILRHSVSFDSEQKWLRADLLNLLSAVSYLGGGKRVKVTQVGMEGVLRLYGLPALLLERSRGSGRKTCQISPPSFTTKKKRLGACFELASRNQLKGKDE